MSAVALYSEDVDESTGQTIWPLLLRCGHTVTCGRFSERPPTQRPNAKELEAIRRALQHAGLLERAAA